MVKSLVLTGFGINCEEEMAAAYRMAGAEADIVHINEVLGERCSIHEYHIMNFPGGFSFGDDLGSAKVLANKLKYRKMKSGRLFFDEIERFLGDGKYICGVCNGFQLLVKTGLLPNVSGKAEQEVSLSYNDSGKFEDRWCHCIVNPDAKTPFLRGIQGIDLPVRHGEGKLVIAGDEITEQIITRQLNCLSYSDDNGNPTMDYPYNPNGSEISCAGLTDSTGQIFGLMPHPEAFLSTYNHPNWGQIMRDRPERSEKGDGLKIFTNIVNHLS